MLEHYHDKQPATEKLQELIANKAATDMLLDKNKEALNDDKVLQPKPRKSMRRIILCFVALYIVTTVVATGFIKTDSSERFEKNLRSVAEYFAFTDIEDEANFLNGIYRLSATKDDYQYISAALYDANGDIVAKTVPCVRIETDDETYCFELEQYFVKPEIKTLLLYASDSSKEYIVEARVGVNSKKLLSMRFTTSSLTAGLVTVWEWENDAPALANEDAVQYREKTLLSNVLQIPHTDDEKYEEYRDEKYLWEFEDKINTDVMNFKRNADETREEWLQKLEVDGETYWIIIRSTMSPMQATLEMLLPMYITGFVLTVIGIFFTVHELKKYKTK